MEFKPFLQMNRATEWMSFSTRVISNTEATCLQKSLIIQDTCAESFALPHITAMV